MYIQPDSDVYLLRGVPLDNSYSDTIYFADKVFQQNHFLSYINKYFPRQTYQRVNKGAIRLQIKADDIYNYNYMMFRNTAYGSKWFYAFITSVDYINDNTSQINYELDVMQTWAFDYRLEASYVEREHSAGDNIGDNIAPEPIDLGQIKCNAVIDTGLFDSYMAVIAMAENEQS